MKILKIIGNTKLIWIATNQSNYLLNYISIAILATHLNPEHFGDLSSSRNLIAVLLIIINLGFDRSGIYLFKQSNESKIATGICIRLGTFIITALIYFTASDNSKELTVLLIIFTISLTNIFDIKFLFDIKNKIHVEILISIFKILPSFLYSLCILLDYTNASTEKYLVTLLVGHLTYIILQYMTLRKKPHLSFNPTDAKEQIKYTSFVWLGSILSAINNYGDSFIILTTHGKTNAGIYNFAYTIYTGLLFITAIVIRFKIASSLNKKISKKSTNEFLMKSILLSITIFAITYTSLPPLVELYFKDYEQSIPIIKYLLISFVIVSSGSIFGSSLISFGLSKLYFISMLATASLNLIANLLITPEYGIKAAAIINIASSITAVVLSYHFFRNHFYK